MDWLVDHIIRTQLGWERVADAIVVTLIVLFFVNVALCLWIVWTKGRRPNAALAWIAALFAFPVLGLALYILIGENRIGVIRKRRHRRIVQQVRANEPAWQDLRVGARHMSAEDSQLARVAEKLGAPPVLNGNAVDVIGDPHEQTKWMLHDIDAATKTVHVLFYIMVEDDTGEAICQALERAVERGVKCRLLLDGIGSKRFLRSRRRKALSARGVQVVEALPASLLRVLVARVDIRNHRKLLVIDGRVAQTGSRNIADPSFKAAGRLGKREPYVDSWIRIRGPVVLDMQTMFVEDWELDTGEDLSELLGDLPPFIPDGLPVQVIPSGPNFDNSVVAELIQASIQLARREVMLCTPYFLPDEATIAAMEVAARRGLRVTVIVPRANDSLLCAYASRSHFERLLEAGVEIWEFKPGFLHSKTVTVDDEIGIVTTANLDRRSYEINFEASVVVYSRVFSEQLRILQAWYVSRSVRVESPSWCKRPFMARFGENFANLVSPLL